MSATRSDRVTPPSESRVGDYQLLAKIGEGGMGVVHLAQATDGRRVALKVLRPHIIGDDEARSRLAREVASMRRVRSPRIAEVIDADPWGEVPYVATRYVPGLSLHEHVRQEGPLAGGDLRHVAAGLAEAVLTVHSVGVLHRDIKPSNVLLEGRWPVLIDFGLARLADDPRLTVTGWLLGTPGYLAPEILYGEEASTASDVHSWAATVAFAATGSPPFGRGPAVAIMDRVRRGEHDLSAVPADLAPILRACLDSDAAARPTLSAVHADLVARGGDPRSRRTAPGPRPSREDTTLPYVLATARDDDATDVLDRHPSRLAEAQQVAATMVDGPTAVQPRPGVGVAPARTWQPAPPDADAAFPSPQERSGRRGHPAAGAQRGLLLTGLLCLVALGFASTPYLAIAAVGVAALALRTFSWTTESVRERGARRGSRRWYDVPVATLATPWYLLVAAGGTFLLVLWAGAIAAAVGVGLLLLRPPLEPGLTVLGAVFALGLWWGPGGRRLRGSTRALAGLPTRWAPVGWMAVAATAVAVGVLASALASSGVSWEPQPGPPWREGTMLGDLMRLL
jgi:serine/threonine protein kinase